MRVEINITVEGKSGHGAEPFEAYDPIIKSAQIIQDLSRIKSHQITSYEPSSLTICSIQGGNAFNVIRQFDKLWHGEIPIKLVL